MCILNEGYGWHDLNQTEVLAVRAAIKVKNFQFFLGLDAFTLIIVILGSS